MFLTLKMDYIIYNVVFAKINFNVTAADALKPKSIRSSSTSISNKLSAHKPHLRFKSVKILRLNVLETISFVVSIIFKKITKKNDLNARQVFKMSIYFHAQGHKNHGACKYMLSEMLLLQKIFLKSIYKKHLNREKLNLNATAADALSDK
ncbi:hypothetical protein PHYBLDRAFT_170997 [Phycomyces blakesleeanus NRRL 1555(-)]|uniref:Uncharacterized protein n=1 Tax=Phycomyces blakesleeanus (strain ATCC 8743b / DSM 1359 / FGSC 10004 / NBRC 33097 / NRRL 1555) TaxID=763407 RepID=A0A167LQQ3_PHYB8|nr:hypothetical protein PHYBLDRAFT_170997 [Phycomyces blakesleeanus NRRL 1555(-)]OAD70918.1 hypothetical protein PHYBLDRAFT_170997 [Phycomyces blakesleeanus NRRL 1555(-)]|eukprot:XP_018288958.1 hypothetical protein PHYBLDRAFT_170997 [Phycomyces blakesleeanus NRRL 1555(-)]